MKFIIKHKILFYTLQLTWGLLLNLLGFIIALCLICTKHKPIRFGNNFYFKVGKTWGGLELGIFFLCGRLDDSHHLKCHESGHGIQNIIWGPLFPFVICIPSAIRYWYRELRYYRKGKYPKTDYDDIWFEGQATKLGEKYYGDC